MLTWKKDDKVCMCVRVQSREQRKIEAIEKTFEKIEQRQKSGKRATVADVEPAKTDAVSAFLFALLLCIEFATS